YESIKLITRGKEKLELDVDLRDTISYLNGKQSIDSAISNYNAVYAWLHSNVNIDVAGQKHIAIVFNGAYVTGRAFSKYFSSIGAKTLFSEISNLPGKMIYDCKGVNAQSYLHEKPTILDHFDVNEKRLLDEHNRFLQSYLEYKETPPMQSKLGIIWFLPMIFDHVFVKFLGVMEDDRSFISKVKYYFEKRKVKSLNINCKTVSLEQPYAFYPTQVSSDTQLKLNSDIDNIEALEHIISNYDERVLVKVHPAETDLETIKKYESLEQSGHITLVSNNTLDLIKNSRVNFTINSTVGLESKILGKKTVTLGRAIYSNLSTRNLHKYLHCYLVDLEFFAIAKVDDAIIDKLFFLSEIKE
ncbi:hypothetical protein, partial [Vibrio breoganii]|uniref:capsular polysaccharide export protein, LipB/KpsS family n=1 Tax=Vibrio breoganii TaxID=553239 RepID=UPI000C83BA42